MIKKNIPNAMTLGNLFCGCLAIFCLSKGLVVTASIFVGFALVLDFFDGFTARWLGVTSPIGKDLDSLADMVTFGVVPGFYMFGLILNSQNMSWSDLDVEFFSDLADWRNKLPFVAFLITVFSCLRLARFNNDSRQSDGFIGMPTPANTMLVASLALLNQTEPLFLSWLIQPYLLVTLSVLLSYLLVAELPLIALKFKSFDWKNNAFRYSLIILSVILMALLKLKSIPLIIGLYILISIVNNIFSKKAL